MRVRLIKAARRNPELSGTYNVVREDDVREYAEVYLQTNQGRIKAFLRPYKGPKDPQYPGLERRFLSISFDDSRYDPTDASKEQIAAAMTAANIERAGEQAVRAARQAHPSAAALWAAHPRRNPGTKTTGRRKRNPRTAAEQAWHDTHVDPHRVQELASAHGLHSYQHHSGAACVRLGSDSKSKTFVKAAAREGLEMKLVRLGDEPAVLLTRPRASQPFPAYTPSASDIAEMKRDEAALRRGYRKMRENPRDCAPSPLAHYGQSKVGKLAEVAALRRAGKLREAYAMLATMPSPKRNPVDDRTLTQLRSHVAAGKAAVERGDSREAQAHARAARRLGDGIKAPGTAWWAVERVDPTMGEAMRLDLLARDVAMQSSRARRNPLVRAPSRGRSMSMPGLYAYDGVQRPKEFEIAHVSPREYERARGLSPSGRLFLLHQLGFRVQATRGIGFASVAYIIRGDG